MADLSWIKRIVEKSTMAPCTAIMTWPECAGSHATMSLVQATLFKWLHPCLPVEMAQMSLLASERVGEENRTCQPGRDQQGNKRSIRFRLGELYWLVSQLFPALIWQSMLIPQNTVIFNEWKATSHSFMSNLSLGVELLEFFFLPSLCWICFRVFSPPLSHKGWKCLSHHNQLLLETQSQQGRCHWNKVKILTVHSFHLCFLKIYHCMHDKTHHKLKIIAVSDS